MLPQTEQPQPSQPKNKRKQALIITGAALLLVLLTGAAFLAGALLNKHPQGQNGLIALPQGIASGSGPISVSSSLKIDILPAKELPTLQPDVRGVFVARSGGSFTIGTGSMGITVVSGGSGVTSGTTDASPQTSYDGPAYEVVVTKDTRIYLDTTQMDPNSTDTPIQQTVSLGTLTDFNTMSMLSVWGKKTGSRYVADVILCMQPMIKAVGGTGGALK